LKIAVISDIHGNLEALKSTIEDIQKKEVDKIICLGDIIAKGIHPNECVDLIKKYCDVVIQGNCDRHFSKKHDLENIPEIEQKRIKWNQSIITKENLKYLNKLPFCYELYISGSLVRFFHATPKQDNIAILNVDSIETKYNMFKSSENTISKNDADVVIYGHIHHPYMDRLYNKTLINVGSVGNSFDVIRNVNKDSNILETTKSNYLIIEGELGEKTYGSNISFQFVRVSYNIDKELQDEEINIEKENYRYELIEGKYRNMEKVNENFKKLGIDIDTI
jgi:protein phosphatase